MPHVRNFGRFQRRGKHGNLTVREGGGGMVEVRVRRQGVLRALLRLVGGAHQAAVVDREVGQLQQQRRRAVGAAAVHVEAQLPGALQMEGGRSQVSLGHC